MAVPKAILCHLPSLNSDHCPLLLSFNSENLENITGHLEDMRDGGTPSVVSRLNFPDTGQLLGTVQRSMGLKSAVGRILANLLQIVLEMIL